MHSAGSAAASPPDDSIALDAVALVTAFLEATEGTQDAVMALLLESHPTSAASVVRPVHAALLAATQETREAVSSLLGGHAASAARRGGLSEHVGLFEEPNAALLEHHPERTPSASGRGSSSSDSNDESAGVAALDYLPAADEHPPPRAASEAALPRNGLFTPISQQGWQLATLRAAGLLPHDGPSPAATQVINAALTLIDARGPVLAEAARWVIFIQHDQADEVVMVLEAAMMSDHVPQFREPGPSDWQHWPF